MQSYHLAFWKIHILGFFLFTLSVRIKNTLLSSCSNFNCLWHQQSQTQFPYLLLCTLWHIGLSSACGLPIFREALILVSSHNRGRSQAKTFSPKSIAIKLPSQLFLLCLKQRGKFRYQNNVNSYRIFFKLKLCLTTWKFFLLYPVLRICELKYSDPNPP